MQNTICPLPWINLAQRKDGSCNVCDNNIITTSGIVNEEVSTDFQSMRKEMLNGQKPTFCKKCFAEESQGFQSKRQKAIKEHQTFSAENENPLPLKRLEVYSDFASDIEDISSVEVITFLENNSLELDSHYAFLMDLVYTERSKHISLKYNLCNMAGLNNKIINVWGMFKHVTFNASVDGVDDKHNWFNPDMPFNKLISLLSFLSSVRGNHVDVNITARVNLLTAPFLDTLARWRRDSNYAVLNSSGNLLNLYLDPNPNLDIRRLPSHLKGFTRLKIERLLDQHRIDTMFNANPEGRKAWQGIIDYMYSADLSQNLPDTLNYIKEQDNLNGTNWKDVFENLSDIEDEVV